MMMDTGRKTLGSKKPVKHRKTNIDLTQPPPLHNAAGTAVSHIVTGISFSSVIFIMMGIS